LIEPIVFAGYPKLINTRISTSTINDIDFNMIEKNVTAIGDAIVFAIQYANTSGRNYSKKIFITGDGDNTAG
jgi:hypothetical protein